MNDNKRIETKENLDYLLIEFKNGILNEDTLMSFVNFATKNQVNVEMILTMVKSMDNTNSLDVFLNNLGLSFWNAKEFDYVIPFFQEALKVNAENDDTLFNLGYILYKLEEISLALTYLESIKEQSIEVVNLIEEIKIRQQPSFLKEYKVEITQIPNVPNPIYVRMDTSDPYVFRQIFQFREYEMPNLPFCPKLIIDGGANVGYASIWFSNIYPEAKIIAIEPDQSNFEVLKHNTAPYRQVELINSGLWDKNTFLNVKDIGLGKWGLIVEETNEPNPNSFKAITIESILENSEFDEIDILKIDIEGAEKELFSFGYEKWLDKVKIIIIELHDRMKLGCSHAFFKAISQYNFSLILRGENLILVKEELFLKL